jgi:uncharacterized membrane protein
MKENSDKQMVRLQSFLSSRKLFFAVLMLQLVFVALVIFDIPVARQVFVFLYLTFIPGLIFLRILNCKKLRQLEMILLSLGFSIAFLMIFGVLANELGLLIGISNPLSEISLIIVLNSALLVFSIPKSRMNENSKLRIAETVKTVAKTPLAILFLCLPILSLVGSVWNNIQQDNSILLFMIIGITLLFTVGFLSRKLLPSKLYPVILLSIAIALVFHRSLVSNYVQAGGSDIYNEFAVFTSTKDNSFWNQGLGRFSSSITSRYNDMLSITILPTILSNLMNMDPTWIMKLLYPLLFAFVPLSLYYLWETQFGPRIALISTFLFMAEQTFYTEMLGLARQMIAELFVILLLIVILRKEMEPPKKMLCFTIFSFALIASHYAMSLIFVFFLLFTLLASFIIKRGASHPRKITLTLVVLFSVLMFSWYIYTSQSATFDSMLNFATHVYEELGEWANPAARGTTVLRGLGLEASPSIWNSISRGVAYFTQLIIFIGFVGLITKRVKTQINREYFTFAMLSMALLAALIAVPGLAETLRMTRFYHILLFFLAPLGALGADTLIKAISKNRTKVEGTLLFLAVLVPYFLFQTNFVYEVVGSDSWSIPLSKYRMDSLRLYASYSYIDGPSVFGAKWLLENTDPKHARIYADAQALRAAVTYAGLTLQYPLETLSNATIPMIGGTIYLNKLNTVYGKIVGEYNRWNYSDLSFLNDLDLTYSNGACEIYRNP